MIRSLPFTNSDLEQDAIAYDKLSRIITRGVPEELALTREYVMYTHLIRALEFNRDKIRYKVSSLTHGGSISEQLPLLNELLQQVDE